MEIILDNLELLDINVIIDFLRKYSAQNISIMIIYMQAYEKGYKEALKSEKTM